MFKKQAWMTLFVFGFCPSWDTQAEVTLNVWVHDANDKNLVVGVLPITVCIQKKSPPASNNKTMCQQYRGTNDPPVYGSDSGAAKRDESLPISFTYPNAGANNSYYIQAYTPAGYKTYWSSVTDVGCDDGTGPPVNPGNLLTPTIDTNKSPAGVLNGLRDSSCTSISIKFVNDLANYHGQAFGKGEEWLNIGGWPDAGLCASGPFQNQQRGIRCATHRIETSASDGAKFSMSLGINAAFGGVVTDLSLFPGGNEARQITVPTPPTDNGHTRSVIFKKIVNQYGSRVWDVENIPGGHVNARQVKATRDGASDYSWAFDFKGQSRGCGEGCNEIVGGWMPASSDITANMNTTPAMSPVGTRPYIWGIKPYYRIARLKSPKGQEIIQLLSQMSYQSMRESDLKNDGTLFTFIDWLKFPVSAFRDNNHYGRHGYIALTDINGHKLGWTLDPKEVVTSNPVKYIPGTTVPIVGNLGRSGTTTPPTFRDAGYMGPLPFGKVGKKIEDCETGGPYQETFYSNGVVVNQLLFWIPNPEGQDTVVGEHYRILSINHGTGGGATLKPFSLQFNANQCDVSNGNQGTILAYLGYPRDETPFTLKSHDQRDNDPSDHNLAQYQQETFYWFGVNSALRSLTPPLGAP